MFKYLIILLLFSPCVFGEIVFQDDFDDHTDWTSPEQQLNSGSDTSVSDGGLIADQILVKSTEIGDVCE